MSGFVSFYKLLMAAGDQALSIMEDNNLRLRRLLTE